MGPISQILLEPAQQASFFSPVHVGQLPAQPAQRMDQLRPSEASTLPDSLTRQASRVKV
jgi:hypothetical protein